MFIINTPEPNDAWYQAIDAMSDPTVANLVPSRIARTYEIHPAVMEISNPANRLITAFGRPVNPAFALAEVIWILGGRRDVGMLEHYNSGIGNYSDDGATFNAAYGHRLRWEFGYDQLADVIKGLRANPESRQAVMSIWSPDKDRAYLGPDEINDLLADDVKISETILENKNSTKDRACNITSNLLIRDGKLDWVQTMRSNDIIWGTPNNFMQWMHIMEFVAGQVGVPMGTYYHFVNSLHTYEYHWDDLRQIRHFNLYEQLGVQHEPMDTTWEALRSVLQAEQDIRVRDTLRADARISSGYWASVVNIFEAWKAYKEGQNVTALSILLRCDDKVLAAAQLRYFWWWRWHKMDSTGEGNDFVTRMMKIYGETITRWIIAGQHVPKAPATQE